MDSKWTKSKEKDNEFYTFITDWNGEDPTCQQGKPISLEKCKRTYVDTDLVYWTFFDGQLIYKIFND